MALDNNDYDNLEIDIANIGKFVNDPAGNVAPREGDAYPNIRKIQSELLSSTLLYTKTYAELAAITNRLPGTGAEVLSSDVGTHTDPVVGGTVNNTGRFRWSSSPAGWERIGNAESATLATANAKVARSWISGRIVSMTWSGTPFASSPTVTISAGEQWEENNSGSVKRKIAAIAATALASGEAIVVNFDTGTTDGSGAYIPTKVTLASGGASGWQSANRFVLVGRDTSGLIFGHYVNNSPDLTGSGVTATLARSWISGQIAVSYSGSTPTVSSPAIGYWWIEGNGGSPYRTIAPIPPTALASGEGFIVDFTNGSVDGSGQYIPTKVVIASGGQIGWQGDKNRFILIAMDGAGNLFGEYKQASGNSLNGIYDAEVAFSTAAGTPLPTWDQASRTLSWPELVLIAKNPAYNGRIKLAAGSVVFPSGMYYQAVLDLSQVNNTLTPASAVLVNSYVGGAGWDGNDTAFIPLFAVNNNTAYPVRFPPVIGSLIGPGAPGAISEYDPSELAVIQTANQIDIYKKGSNPASNRYIRFRMQRVTTPAINSDVWRWNEVWECERVGEYNFNALRMLANSGENEMAILITDKTDFMGGTAHGDEELFSVNFMVGGVNKALGGTGNYRTDRVEFVQGSNMYQPDTTPAKSIRVAKSYKRWIFESRYVDVINYIPWEAAVNLAQTYMAMLTWLRNNGTIQISDKGFRSPLYAEENISKSYTIEITGGGSGFTDGETVNITAVDGTGTGMTGVATVAAGAITGVNVNIGTGSNYDLNEAVNITAADGTGTGATGTLRVGFASVYSKSNIAKASGSTGYSAEVEILKGWDKSGRIFNFSPSAAYNKFYFDFTGPNYNTTIGEIFESHARYRIDTIN